MNRDITGNFNKFSSAPNSKSAILSGSTEKILPKNTQLDTDSVKSPLDCLNCMGVAQVKMTYPNVKSSVVEFMKNEEEIAAHVDFCDGLVQAGYKLEEAIAITDEVFANLKKNSTYKQ